ncbi:amidohydrolase family protein [Kordiimonas sp.]|uniref:amidohydrolase family protein n=1 Tax=Kordiimonas sp. TaxID=1970157 RepID=UPI003A958827
MKYIGRFIAASIIALGTFALPAHAETYDIVITNGRVVDPETGLDAVRSLGITDGKIMVVSESALDGARTIDATGRVVSPGFIDMHAHGQDILSARMQALDGVTTGLELEAGMMPISNYYDRAAEEGRPINYGASVNWAHARIATFLDIEPEDDVEWFFEAFAKTNWQEEVATPEQLEKIEAYVEKGLDEGGLGVGILIGYAPGTGHKEFFAVNKLAAERGVPTFTHARYLSMLEPKSSFEGLAEVVTAAAGTGAHTHIVHLNSMSLRDIELIAPMIRKAQDQGLKVTTEAYPYGAGSTGIGAAMFRGDRWRERVGGVDASSFDVGGKRLTEEELKYYQTEKPETQTVIHFLELDDPKDRAFLDMSVLFPGGVIASDGGNWLVDGKMVDQNTWPVPENAWSHPRSAGTYSRFLRSYVREGGEVSLLDAITRLSYGPAKIMQDAVPQMKLKGRIQKGADADIVIFDLDRVADKATYAKPAQASVGFDYVLVNGVVLVDGGEMQTDVLPGKPVRNAVK